MRKLALLWTGLLILAAINITVWRYEYAITKGEVVLLKLAPVDPRSLLQGDYMRLDYDIARQLGSTASPPTDILVIRLDNHKVAHWVPAATPAALTGDQRLLQVRQTDDQWLIGPDAFFFEEGKGTPLAAARYGEFRLQPDGKALLVGLRDEALQPVADVRARW